MADDIKDDDANEPKEHDDEFGEEFDFESEQHEDALAPQEEAGGEDIQEAEAPARRKNVALPLVIGIVVLGFIGWKVYEVLTEPKTQAEGGPKGAQLEVAKVAPKTAPTSGQIATDPSQPKGATPNLYEAEQLAKQAISDEKITAILQKKIDEQFATQKQQIEAIQKEAQNLTQNTGKTLSSLQQDLATLKATVDELNTQFKSIRDEQLAAAAREAEREARARAKAKPKAKPVPKQDASPNISVHAIIPGRAWLRTLDGKTITVTEGDSIGEFGKVLKIDAPNGQVVTSSGVTLR